MITTTPKPPYYAVIFTSILTKEIENYEEMSNTMVKLAQEQHGFLGIESARNELGITVSYWDSLEAIYKWKLNSEHSEAREKGRNTWYKHFKVRKCKVERANEFNS